MRDRLVVAFLMAGMILAHLGHRALLALATLGGTLQALQRLLAPLLAVWLLGGSWVALLALSWAAWHRLWRRGLLKQLGCPIQQARLLAALQALPVTLRRRRWVCSLPATLWMRLLRL